MSAPSPAVPSSCWTRVESCPPEPWAWQLVYAVCAYTLYGLNILAHYLRVVWYSVRPPLKGPDVCKTYACRPSLRVRIYFPADFSTDSTDSKTSTTRKLPTVFTIHGGAFIVGNPEDTDAWNHDFARRHAVLVVALDYRKAPVFPFPCAIHDLEALLRAALADPALPIDPTRVALLGWSAGGNLALAVASLPRIRHRIHAVVPIYPVVNFGITGASKVHARQYKPRLPGLRGRPSDVLLVVAPIVTWAYLPKTAVLPALLTDPLLSPAYLPRDQLPPYCFFIGCELDLLSMEAFRMATQLAGRPSPPDDAKVGCSAIAAPGTLILDDERFAFETRTDKSSYRWLLIPDAAHAFDQGLGTAADEEVKRVQCQAAIAEWLFAGAFRV